MERKQTVLVLELVLAIVFSFVITFKYFSDRRAFEDFDLGANTTSVFAEKKDILIHTSTPSQEFESAIIREVEQSEKTCILILGNSQTHGINQYRKGQENYVGLVSKHFEGHRFVLGHSLPNANLQEHHVIFQYWLNRLPIELLVLPVFYDDLRENNIRQSFFEHIATQNVELDSTIPINKKLKSLLLDVRNASLSDVSAKKFDALQDHSEFILNKFLSENVLIWNSRANIRGEISILLYRLRNTLFGITPQSIRKMIPGIMNDNLASLDEILRTASLRKVNVLLYIPPLRQDVAPPYDMQEYDRFKSELQERVKQLPGVRFLDIDSIVPGQYWGMKDSTNLYGKPEYDFMHFQFEGHRRLFDSISPVLEDFIFSP